MIKKIFTGNRPGTYFSAMLIPTIVLYFYKTAFWPLTYLFIVCYAILIILFLTRILMKLKILNFILDFLIPLILTSVFIISAIVNRQLSNTILQKDILRLVILFSLFYFLYWNTLVNTQKISLKFTINFIIITTLAISILNLIFQIVSPVIQSLSLAKLNISEESTIANDYNFFCVFLLFGLILLNFSNKTSLFKPRYSSFSVIFLNFIFSINIILSGSRRGLLALTILAAVYLIFLAIKWIKEFDIKKILKKTIGFLIVIFLFFIIGQIIYYRISCEKRSSVVYKYASLIGIKDYGLIERFLWEDDFTIPKDEGKIIDKNTFKENPEFWGRYPTPGMTLSKIETPFGEGIRLFKEGNANEGFSFYYTGPKILYYANHTYRISFNIRILKGNFDSFSVGWWTEDGGKETSNTQILDKNIESLGDDWYKCTSTYTFFDNHSGITGFVSMVKNGTEFIISNFELYDLNYVSTLPRFLLEVKNQVNIDQWLNETNPPAYYNNDNLIINGNFAYGLKNWNHSADALSIKIVVEDNRRCAWITRGNGNGMDWSLYYTGWDIKFIKQCKYQIRFKFKPVSSNSIPFLVGYWLDEGDGYINNLELKSDTLADGWRDIKAIYTFKNNQCNQLFPINSQISNSQFYITDFSLVNLTQTQFQLGSNKSDIVTKKESRFSDRTARWSYAIELWKTKYKWYNRLFGHGFDYLEWYGTKFISKEKEKTFDWPHNPFIAILLYSGILGLSMYLWLLYKTIFLYIKYIKRYSIFFIGFLLTFFFSFFSGSHPFDPPIMGFFILLPFFLHSIHNNADQPIN